MDLQIQELKNSIMEEIILKNYKLSQFVEKEMSQMKDEINLLKDEIKLLKNENSVLKINENKLITNDTIVIGCLNSGKVVLSNIVTLVPNYNSCDDLAEILNSIFSSTERINTLMTKKVFNHLNKLNKFKTFNILSMMSNEILIDENLFRIDLWCYNISGSCESTFYTLCKDIKYNHIKQNWKNLLDILDECNIKLILKNSEKCFGESLRDLILS
jgi:hypothetical protein